VNELYPSDRIIEIAMEKGIPFTTASDAHSHVQLGENFGGLAKKMSSFGISEVCVHHKHTREMRVVS
jgi:histidinol-phosphatase (PHP family)